MDPNLVPEVYTAGEIARAVGVSRQQVVSLMATGELPSVNGLFVRHAEAVSWGKRSQRGRPAVAVATRAATSGGGTMFVVALPAPRWWGLPAAVSVAAHLLAGTGVVFFATTGLNSAAVKDRVTSGGRLRGAPSSCSRFATRFRPAN